MFRAAPWADALYAIDVPWWKRYADEVKATFRGECFSATARPGVARAGCPHHDNSGAAAVSLAAHRGALRIVLIGYDLQLTGGQTHSHGDHPAGLGNAGSIAKWPPLFAALAARMKSLEVEVINATRETALRCFPRTTLEQALDRLHVRIREHRPTS